MDLLLFLYLSMCLLPLVFGIAAEDGPPDPVDRSECANTPVAQGNFMLKVVVPALNELIGSVETLYRKVDQLDLDEPEGVSEGVTEDIEFETTRPPEGDGGGPAEPMEGMMEDVQKLGPLLQDLDSRAAENLGDADLADPEALRTATDEELKQISYVGDSALEKIREVYPYDGDQ